MEGAQKLWDSDRWAIEAKGLVKVFEKHQAVDGVAVAIRKGTVYGFLGPNGAG